MPFIARSYIYKARGLSFLFGLSLAGKKVTRKALFGLPGEFHRTIDVRNALKGDHP